MKNHLERQVSDALSHLVEDKTPSEKVKTMVFDSFEKRSRKHLKHSPLRIISYGAAAVVLLIAFFTASIFVFPAIAQAAQNIPFLNSVFEWIGDKGIKDAKSEGLAVAVKHVAEDQRIRLTIKDVLYDDARIVIGFTEECEGGFKEFLNITNDLFVDNKRVSNFGMGITRREVKQNVYAGVLEISIAEQALQNELKNPPGFFEGNLPDEFVLGIYIGEIGGMKGKWEFSIPVSKKESQKKSKIYYPGVSKEYNGVSLAIPEVKFTPSCVQLTVDIKPLEQSKIASYRVFDDRGNELDPLNDRGRAPSFLPVKNIPKYLTLIPYSPSTVINRKELSGQLPITLSQGKTGEISVNKIEFLPDKTLIHYDFEGNAPLMQNNPVMIESEEIVGDEVAFLLEGLPQNENDKQKVPFKTGKKSYIQEYGPIDTTKKLFVTTTSDIEAEAIQEFIIQIPLKSSK